MREKLMYMLERERDADYIVYSALENIPCLVIQTGYVILFLQKDSTLLHYPNKNI
jgi:hypothetical protein